MKESTVSKKIRTYCREANIFCFRHNVIKPVIGKSGHVAFAPVAPDDLGAADLIICHQGKFIAVETKGSEGQQRPEQKEWQERCEAAGGRYLLVRSLSEFIAAL